MTADTNKERQPNSRSCAIDSGISSLVMVASFYQVAADPDQLAHHYGSHDKSWSDQEIVIAARHLKLKARSVSIKPEKLEKLALPAIAKTRDGEYFILAKISNGESGNEQNEKQVLIQYPAVRHLQSWITMSF